MTPQSKTAFHVVLDAAVKAGEKITTVKIVEAVQPPAQSITTTLTPSAVTPPPVVVPPPKPPGPVMNHIHQDQGVWRHIVAPGDTVLISDEMLDGGGFLKAIAGAKSIKLTRCASTGAPRGGGVYFVLLASNPVESFVWDNTGLEHEIWNGGEAALRVMGGAVNVTLINVNFHGRKHDHGDDTGSKSGTPGKAQDWWKQSQQWRDIRKGLVQGGRTIGLIDCGQQKDTSLTPQRVDDLTFDNHAMTSLPTVTDLKTIGIITIKGCPKINEQGVKLGMWPDQVIKGK